MKEVACHDRSFDPFDERLKYLHGTTTPQDATLGLYHSVLLTGLRPGTTYHVQPRSADVADKPSSCDDFTFTTSALNFSLRFDGSNPVRKPDCEC